MLRFRFVSISISLITLAGVTTHAQIRGFAPEEITRQQAFESKLRAVPDAERIRSYAKHMSAAPHAAGTPASKATADYVLSLLKGWGFDARIEQYEALLPYPTHRLLEMVEPVHYKAALKEPAITQDPDSSDPGQLPTYNAYSAPGSVTAPLVYVNYGVTEDYDQLKRLNIDVRGKIVIARYGKSWRGVKPKLAQEHGALACIIYSDPREDGYFAGDIYPAGAYRPWDGVQRGSVIDLSIYPGDPLTPGWADEPGAKRLSRAEAKSLLKIPVLPISYRDAEHLLENLGGPVAPEPWRGALPFTYHVGPGPAKVHLELDFDFAIRPLYNVIASIPGSVWKDQWVLYGNHHDAWVNGANDPVSGASALLETARTLATMQKQGWRPKRTIAFELWDGEEFGIIGSTEWVEKHQSELQRKAVAYLNSDSNGKGALGASGSHSLEQFVTEVLRDVPDPTTQGKSVLDTSRSRTKNEFHLGPLGSGSDYAAFIGHAGIASLNMGFGAADSGGIYHSIYDTFTWFTKFSDGDFKHGRALAQVMSTALVRLADAPVLPFEFGNVARTIRGYTEEIQKLAGESKHSVNFGELTTEIARLEAWAKNYEEALSTARSKIASAQPSKLEPLNALLSSAEQTLTLPAGLPGRPWFKHQIYAPGQYTGYGAKTLPGVREAVEAGRWDEANQQAANAAKAIHNLNGQIERAIRALRIAVE